MPPFPSGPSPVGNEYEFDDYGDDGDDDDTDDMLAALLAAETEAEDALVQRRQAEQSATPGTKVSETTLLLIPRRFLICFVIQLGGGGTKNGRSISQHKEHTAHTS
jgi:hypothetical protein